MSTAPIPDDLGELLTRRTTGSLQDRLDAANAACVVMAREMEQLRRERDEAVGRLALIEQRGLATAGVIRGTNIGAPDCVPVNS